jgi:hypothetical protein
MRDIIEQPPEPGAPAPPLWRRVVWFAVLAFTGAFSTAASRIPVAAADAQLQRRARACSSPSVRQTIQVAPKRA